MSSKYETKVCPICSGTEIRHVSCSHAQCSFILTTCGHCDRPQAVADFVADHEKDCVYGPGTDLCARSVTFVAPRLSLAG